MARHSVLGIDLSLTATGVALAKGCCEVHCKVGPHRLIRTAPDELFVLRQDLIIRSILRYVRKAKPGLVVIEQLAHAPRNKDDRPPKVLGALERELWLGGIPYEFVHPNTLKAFATSNGRASKDDMVEAASSYAELSSYGAKADNVADAVHVARWGLCNFAKLTHGIF